ncbi:REC8 meiotic recombination protein b [Parambassis ranga]|uniref:REC8 meiotic recombination protein b n=1 Tax=Parambassis ranga TaxID=210632 RepID=A0A6P7KPD9_9TELE|nr:meiotic recombination protein REC8 homolog [Parambassis ranga]
MFYYPNVLIRHSGCFSTIWLAATRAIKVPRRELLRVNVKQTCEDIVEYVTAQVPPPQPNLPRPRFSLYLSSQLQYGVILVYHRQCGFLLEEIQQTIDRLLRSQRCIRIDMAEPDRMALDVLDGLYMMEEAEGAQDPFFGLMEMHQLPSPYKTLQTEFVMAEVDSQHSLVPSPNSTLGKEDFRSPPATITMREKEQFVIPTAEYFDGVDFPEATARDIDLLLDQPELFRREVEDHASRDNEGAITSIDQLKETMLTVSEQSSMLPIDKQIGQTVGVSLAAIAQEMTPQHVTMPTPPSGTSETARDRVTGSPFEEMADPPLRKRGGRQRRQLLFADRHTQISDKEMMQQLENPLAETLDLSKILLQLPSLTKHATPAQLFNAPCGLFLHADLQLLWKQQASITVLPGHGEQQTDEDEVKGESEQDREILRTEGKRRYSNMKEMSTESGSQTAECLSVLDVDISKAEKSLSDMITPVSRWSPQEEVQPMMEAIVEENIEIPEAQTDTESRDMLSWIASSLQRQSEVTFDSLLTPKADRFTAAHTFHKLLELLSAGQVTAHQSKPYHNISINTGRMAA